MHTTVLCVVVVDIRHTVRCEITNKQAYVLLFCCTVQYIRSSSRLEIRVMVHRSRRCAVISLWLGVWEIRVLLKFPYACCVDCEVDIRYEVHEMKIQ